MTAPDVVAGSAVSAPVYDQTWIGRYLDLDDADRLVVSAEMTACTQMITSAFGGVPRRTIRHLDAGTCTGRYLRWGVRQGFGLVCGVDSSAAATSLCASTIRAAGVHVYRADLLSEADVAVTAGIHAPFSLVTIMLGTINHMDSGQQTALMRSLARLAGPGGTLVISSWRRGQCALSLYTDAEWRFLQKSVLDEQAIVRLADACQLRLAQTISTPWHLLAILRHE